MKLNIQNEFGTLKSVVVCWGDYVPIYEEFKTSDPEFLKFHPHSWDKKLFLQQQESFFNLLANYGVELIFAKTAPHLIQQMYTRDTAFVVGDKLYYSTIRKFQVRSGEVESLLVVLGLTDDQLVPIESEIEGGDVLVKTADEIYVGLSSRTTAASVAALAKAVRVRTFALGENVMHLDTRLTLLPNNLALVNQDAFNNSELVYLRENYDLIAVTDSEAKKLGTNVFLLNPETVLVPTQHSRIAVELKRKGLKVELLDYSEPINLGGSFRCTTLPLVRE